MGYTHGRKWTDESIKEGILDVMKALDISRMPTSSECRQVTGSHALSNVITKRKGWYKLAEQLGLPIKKSETTTGKKFEEMACKLLYRQGFRTTRMSQNFPYDILVNEFLKVDVKASHVYHGKLGDFYSFNLEKPYATCDVYILLALDVEDNVDKTFIVPSKFVMNQNQISIGTIKSKYARFEGRWDYIQLMSDQIDKIE